MTNEKDEVAKKLESTIFGVVQLMLCVVRTFWLSIVRPHRLIPAVHNEFKDNVYLPPHLFLLICAIAIGLFATIMSGEKDLFSVEAIEHFQSLSLSSYILYSVMLFAIALVAMLFTRFALKGYEARHVKSCQALNFYVIGLFGIGAIFVLLILSQALASLDTIYGPEKDYFIIGAICVILAYVGWTLFLFHSFTIRSLRMSTGEVIPAAIRLKVLVTNLLVLMLCIINFLYPVSESAAIKSPLKGWVLELSWLDEDQIKLYYQLENTGDREILFSNLELVDIYLDNRNGQGLPLKGIYCTAGGKRIEDSDFISVGAEKSRLFALCINPNLLVDFLVDSKYQETRLDLGKKIFRPTDTRIDITVKPKVYSGSYSDRAIIRLK